MSTVKSNLYRRKLGKAIKTIETRIEMNHCAVAEFELVSLIFRLIRQQIASSR